MPSYDLACTACGHAYEIFATRLLRDGDRVCPACGSPGARVLITAFVTSRPPRDRAEPRITGFAGRGCCGGACAHG
ncbi:MAG: FmdB family zinc ribbon protein [Thermoleophilia bacterium]